MAAIGMLAAAAPVAEAIPGSVAAGPSTTPAEVAAERGGVVPGEAIVRFERGTGASERRAARADANVDFDRSLPVGLSQVVAVEGDVASAVKRLERQPGVADAQPNYRYEALAPAPNDTYFGDLWGMGSTALPNPGVDALGAWDTTRGAGQVIAVLDTGVALDHPDIDVSGGYDFVDGDGDPDDFQFHGTHVAGTAAGTAGNGIGVAGVAPDAQVMAVRVLDGDGSGSTAGIAAGISYAAVNGADVINMSLGGPADEDALMSAAISQADAADVVVVVAAGNDARNNDQTPSFPCVSPQPNLICVAALNQAGGLAGFSNYGATTVDVGAPGTNVLSAMPDYKQVWANGVEGTGWVYQTYNGGLPWGFVTTPRTQGTHAAADSPAGDYGAAIDPTEYAEATLTREAVDPGVSLVGERGCRIEFALRHDLEDDFDYLRAGAVAGLLADHRYFTGSTGGSYFREEVSISDLDGWPGVKPRFTVLSDDTAQEDGAYVDDLSLHCRDSTYVNGAPSYGALNGTSMAAPHVAGVAALVRAADPSASDVEVVEAIKASGLPLASLAGTTTSGRAVDAAAAIALALGHVPPPQPPGPAPVAPSPAPAPAPVVPAVERPAKADLSRSKRRIRVSRRGVFAYSFRATPGLTGRATFKARRKTVAAKRFTVRPGGKVTVKARLSKKRLRALRRKGKLVLRVSVLVRNSAGQATATRKLVLKPPKR
jgi:thermitase